MHASYIKLSKELKIGIQILIGQGVFKGVLHPRPVFGLFLHFSQKLQSIGNK